MWMMLASLIAAAASAAANKRAGDKEEAQRKKMLQLETERQDALGEKALDLNTETQDQFSRANQDASLADAFASRNKAMQAAAPRQEAYIGSTSKGPEVISDEISRLVGKAAERTGGQGEALARMRSLDDVGLENDLKLLDTSRELSGMQLASQRSSDILPYELDASRQAGQRYRSLADLFRMGGMGMSAFGSAGAGGGAGEVRNPYYRYQTPVSGAGSPPPRLPAPM